LRFRFFALVLYTKKCVALAGMHDMDGVLLECLGSTKGGMIYGCLQDLVTKIVVTGWDWWMVRDLAFFIPRTLFTLSPFSCLFDVLLR
jgi:hypothetical protein